MQLLKYVPTCSVASKRYCTNSTLCTGSVDISHSPQWKIGHAKCHRWGMGMTTSFKNKSFLNSSWGFRFGIERPIPDIPDSEFPLLCWVVTGPLYRLTASRKAEKHCLALFQLNNNLDCKTALQKCIAKLHCKNALQNCIAKLHCRTALQLMFWLINKSADQQFNPKSCDSSLFLTCQPLF